MEPLWVIGDDVRFYSENVKGGVRDHLHLDAANNGDDGDDEPCDGSHHGGTVNLSDE